MDIVGVSQSSGPYPGPVGAPRSGWWGPALAGAAAFWLANLAISLTPVAADYRVALSISYVPMLVEAAAGGLVIAAAVSFLLTRFMDRVPGRGPLRQALGLAGGALVLATLVLGLPSVLRSDVDEPGCWLLVSTVINAIRFLALGVAVGLVTRARARRPPPRHPVVRRGAPS